MSAAYHCGRVVACLTVVGEPKNWIPWSAVMFSATSVQINLAKGCITASHLPLQRPYTLLLVSTYPPSKVPILWYLDPHLMQGSLGQHWVCPLTPNSVSVGSAVSAQLTPVVITVCHLNESDISTNCMWVMQTPNHCGIAVYFCAPLLLGLGHISFLASVKELCRTMVCAQC